MKTVGNVVLAAGLAVVTAWLAHLHVVSQSYHPVVQLASPDGLIYTAVQDAKQERPACGAANDRLLAPVKETCKTCKVVVARCERQLAGFELDVHERRHVPYPVVSGPGVRMAIAGPHEPAKASCERIAGEMIRSGLRTAACVHPS